MQQNGQTLTLRGDTTHITNEDAAYRVNKGTVDVYIIPWNDLHNHKPIRIYSAKLGEMIPSLKCDGDFNHRSWRFEFKAISGEAEISVIPNGNSRKLKNEFLKRAEIPLDDAHEYETSLVDHYMRRRSEERRASERQRHSREEAKRDNRRVILDGFSGLHEPQFSADSSNATYNAAKYICSACRIPIAGMNTILTGGNDLSLEDVAKASRFSCREVTLQSNWYRNDCGPFISSLEDGTTIACVPCRYEGYRYYNAVTGKTGRVTPEIAQSIYPKAWSIYSSFPDKSMKWKDLFRFGAQNVRRFDIFMAALLMLAGTLISALLPTLNQKIYDDFIPLGSGTLLLQMCFVIGSFMIGNVFFSIVKNLSFFRASSRLAYTMQNATYDRIFNLPENFFRRFESADLAVRAMSIGRLTSQFTSIVVTTSLSTLFSLVYLLRMFKYSAKLTWIAFLLLIVYSALVYWITSRSIHYDRKIQESDNQANSIFYQLIRGIDKIRMAGAEDRSQNVYLQPYIKSRKLEFVKGKWTFVGNSLSGIVSTMFSMIFYFLIIHKKWNISIGSFIAFNSAFGLFSSSVLAFVQNAMELKSLRPLYERFSPIIREAPEHNEAKEVPPATLNGGIELSHILFAYEKDGDPVINDISLKIEPGQYVGIVGPSGCGKSTLLKLLLGFETPVSGKITYSGMDLNAMDKQSIRKHFGVVLQNGDLIAGSIYENITITNPKASIQDVNEIVREVGLQPDIDEMPMRLQTILNEDAGTISGGQKQRILIARALISNPEILFFDEATSALDNITQAKVCESIRARKNCTRIVIAHRINTIRYCDRIIVLENGRIIEQGSYDALLEKRGLFYELAARQTV